MVEDPAKLEMASDQYERDLEEFEHVKKGEPGIEWRKQYEPSMPAAFRDMFKRDPSPFDSVEVVATAPKKAAA